MTPFQKAVLLKEEQRQSEQAKQQQQGGGAESPSGALNARSPRNSGRSEHHHYKNSGEYETPNEATFVD
jgi:hypothetical protein